MKNKKNTTFTINYRLVKHTKKGNGVKHVYSLEYFCSGIGDIMITEYHGLMKNGKIVQSHLRNRFITGGYKLAHRLYDSCNHDKFDACDEIHTNVI